ncbi:MAG: TetR/AcrR family transcriptional regulator [Acidiferrobacterales bacterium]|nr:TetR/AcrR family transcriptional regulator [Acidiferrobacterales bacterium]
MVSKIDKSVGKKYKQGLIRGKNEELILKAACDQFVLYGYSGTSIQAIADKAKIPKANIHYYFKTKENLYHAVLHQIIEMWNTYLDDMKVENDPKEVLDTFIRRKVEMSYTHPKWSKLFAMEVIQGAPHLKKYMTEYMRPWVTERADVINEWVKQGKLKPVNPQYLIFSIWGLTQHFADFSPQILTILDKKKYSREMVDEIADFVSEMVLTRLGL